MRILDTNIIIWLLTKDDSHKAAACETIFQRVAEGKETVLTTQVILSEVAYVLSSKLYHLSHEDIRNRLLPILAFNKVVCNAKPVCIRAFNIYAKNQQLDFSDAFSVALMEHKNITEIYSYNTDFDSFSGITRIEPKN